MITDSTRDYRQPRLPWKGSNTNLLDKVSRDITVQLLQQFGGSLCSVLQHKKYDKNSNKYGNTLLTSTKEKVGRKWKLPATHTFPMLSLLRKKLQKERSAASRQVKLIE